MNFGLNQQQLDYVVQEIVLPLTLLGAKVWCFGSRARGDYQEFSDLDLMVEAPIDLGPDISQLLEKVEESNFPYKIDIVQLQKFASSYRANFEREKILLSLSQ